MLFAEKKPQILSIFFVCLLTYNWALLIVGSVTLTVPPKPTDHIGTLEKFQRPRIP